MADQTNEELDVTTPMGSVSFKGAQMFPVILVLLLSAFFGLLVWQSDSRSADRDAVTHASVSEAKAAIKESRDAMLKLESTQRAMIYVLALPQAEREKLNLMKPRELGEMQR